MMFFADRNAFARLLYSAGLFGALWTLLAAAAYFGDSALMPLVIWVAGLSAIAFAAVRFWNLLAHQELLEERLQDREQLLQQQLKDSEERFRQVAENLHLVFWITAPDLGRVFYINPAYADIWQRSCASMFLEPMSWLDAVAPDDKPFINSGIELLKNGDFSEAQQLECRIIRPEGSVRWVLLKFIPVCRDTGEVLRIIASAEDITGRRHAEHELQKLQKELDDTQCLASIGSWDICSPGYEMHWSAQLYRILGYEPGEVIPGKEIFAQHIHPEDREDYFLAHNDLSAGTKISQCRIIARDGLHKQIMGRARLEYDAAGSLSRMYGTIQDYTEQKQMENALRESESRYHSLFSSMQEGFALYEITADAQGATADCRLIDINPAFEHLTGLKREMILGRALAEQYPAINRQWIEVFGQVGQTGNPQRFESYSADSSRYYSIYAYRPQALRIAVILTDITSQKQAETLVKKNELRLESLYSLSKKVFISESELIDFALEEVVRLTESKIGYFHILQNDQRSSETITWSSQARAQCSIDQAAPACGLAHAEIWADCIRKKKPVIHTNADEMPKIKNFPQGHIAIQSHMSTPIFEHGRIVAVAGVGNKQTTYEEADIRQMHLFMDGLWRELARRRAEERLKQSNAVLEDKVSQRAAELEKINEQMRIENRWREKALADLAESEKRFSQIAELARELIWEVDREGMFTYVSSACQSVWGYRCDELKCKLYFYDIHQEQGREEFKNSVFAVFKRMEFFRGFLHTVCTKKGEIRLMSTNGMPLFDAAGNFEGYRGLAADITEQMQTQEELRKASTYNRNLIETSLDFIAVFDARGIITDVNYSMETVTGLSRAELIGSDSAQYFTTPDKAREVFHQVLREGYLHNCSLEIKHRSGFITPVLYNASVHRDENGEPVGIFVTARDIADRRRTEAELDAYRSQLEDIVWKRTKELMNEINERKRAEEELQRINLNLQETTVYAREMAQKAELANSAKSEFLANMSHEIRTPMNAILGLSHLAQQTSLTSRQKDYLSKLDSAAQSLLTIINDILDFSKIEAGKLEIQPSVFALSSVFDNLTSILSLRAQEKGLELLFDIGFTTPGFFEGDCLRLQQVLVNLAGNAIKFTEHGAVVISVYPVLQDESGVKLRFMVKDSGIGIRPEDQKMLFQPFTQADTTMTRQFGGTGLGLAISQRLVDLMGGSLTVESEPDKGSVFQFDIRFGLCAAEGVGLHAGLMIGDNRVLVVDDSDTVREVLQKMLETMGLRVETVATGIECLHRLENPGPQGFYDLVISDWKMPGMDGIELAQNIKNLHSNRSPLILIITGYGADDMKTASGELVIDGWLEKPVTLSSLYEAVTKSLGINGPEKKQAGGIQQSAVPVNVTGARVLVVEDNELNRQVAGEILTGAGVLVSHAANGIEAVAAVKDGHFDAVLMDIHMPLMDGYTATSKIRKWEKKINRQRRIPIIAMTAHAFRTEYEMSIQAGMDDHLTKPINAADMLSVVARWMPKNTLRNAEPLQANGPEPQAVVNTAEAIARINGNLDLYIKILKIYKNNLPPAQEIMRHFKQGDVQIARREAHTAKGMSEQIGASGLHGIAAGLEESIRAGDEANVEKHAMLFVEELEKVITCIDTFVNTAQCSN